MLTYLATIQQIMQRSAINLNGLFLIRPIDVLASSIDHDHHAESVIIDRLTHRPSTSLNKQAIGYTIWLESEAASIEFSDQHNPECDAMNMNVVFDDGDEFAFTIATFNFLAQDLVNQPELEVYPLPDILIKRLDRPTIERMVEWMLETGQFDQRDLIPIDQRD